ncbi:uncharacterized protein LOC132720478, partial [Ruditapes philippinarum]|uniref:uncharacterized protein LOC132720478 n=1 Tax=Ruditapes philippinarum TaxID=129788 RepID=UPI00295BCCC7
MRENWNRSGAGILHYCGYTVLAAHFSHKWRPLTITVSSAGIPLAALFIPPTVTVLIDEFDWRKAYMFLACLSLVGVPVVYFFFPSATSFKISIPNTGNQETRNILRFLKNINIMLYFISTFILYVIVYVPVTFLPDLMHEYNRSSEDIYICLMTLGSCDLVSRMFSGFLILKKPSYVAFIHSGGIMLYGMSSVLITQSKSTEAFVIISGLIGIGTEEDVRLGFGKVITFGGFALIGGMPLAGFISDYYGTERGAFIFS